MALFWTQRQDIGPSIVKRVLYQKEEAILTCVGPAREDTLTQEHADVLVQRGLGVRRKRLL